MCQDACTRVHEKADTHRSILSELTNDTVYGSQMRVSEEGERGNGSPTGSREFRRIQSGLRFRRGTRQDPEEEGGRGMHRTQRKGIVDCGAYEFLASIDFSNCECSLALNQRQT